MFKMKSLHVALGGALLLAVSALSAQITVKSGEKIAFLGDSITQQGNWESGYINLVMSALEANGIKAVKIPAGISGHKSNQMLARLDPQSYVEKDAIVDAGIDMRAVLTVNDLVKSDDCFFAATGISGGDFLRGVRYSARHAVTHSLVLRGKTGTLRYVESYHNMDRLSKISAVNY